MYRKSFVFNIIFVFFTSIAIAQGSFSISGVIKDNYGATLPGANLSIKDDEGVYLQGASSDTGGHFIFTGLSSGIYHLEISYLGFENFAKEITLLNKNAELGTIQLNAQKSNALQVQIQGRAAAIQQKEDTTEFNAGSYKVNVDANADDLLKKMPGMDLSSGTPKAQGENITKVLVDGKPFFGDDPTSSLKNIPAEIIDKIQLYDEKSDQAQFTGFDDGNTTKTVNILTKAGRKEGIFGKVYAGYGYEDKYSAGGNLNYFKDNRRISLIGISNNVNIQNFDAQDLIGVSGGGRGGGRGGNRNNNFMVNPLGGISKTNAIGINYSDKLWKKVDITASYFFNQSNNIAEQDLNRFYVLPSQTGQQYTESSRATTNNANHRFNMRLNYEIDSFNSILFIPKISIQDQNFQSNLTGKTIENSLDLLNQTVNQSNSQNNSYNISSMFLFRHKFKKQGRTFSLWANGGQNKTITDGSLIAQNAYSDTLLDSDLNQELSINNQGWNLNSNLTYTEPLSKKSYLQVQYGYRLEDGKADKRTYDFNEVSNDYSLPDSLLSNTFSTQYTTQNGGLGYRFSDSLIRLNVGVNYQSAQLENQRILPKLYDYSRTFNDFLPYAMLSFQFSKRKSLRLNYRTSTNAPNVNQLQDVIDNSNPLQLSTGNPNLNAAYQHNVRIRYNATNPGKSTTFFAMISGNFTRNYIGRSTQIADENLTINNDFILPKGGQFMKPENLDGYYNLNAFTTFGMPVDFLKSNLNLNLQAGMVRTPGLINSEINFANNKNLGLGFTLGSNISEKIDFTLSSNGSYNWVNNTLNVQSDNQFYNQTTNLSMNYVFWKDLVLHTDLNHLVYTGLSEGYNQNFLLLNMSIGKKLFNNKQGELKLSVFDLLNQNKSIQRTVSEIYTQDLQTNVLQRYFMLSFTYNLRFFKGSTSMKDAMPKGGPEPYWN